METFNHLFPQTLSSFFKTSHFIPPLAGKATKKVWSSGKVIK